MKINRRTFLIAMANAGITSKTLSQISGVSKATITNIKRGEYSTKPNTVGALANALNVSVTDLLEEQEREV